MSEGFDAGYYDDLSETLAEAWRRLGRGAADRRSAFHTVQLATVAADGPRVRTVVLRAAERASRVVRIHTDVRSPKAAEIAADPRVELCGYDAGAKLQLRLRGVARLAADDAAADAAWAGSQVGSRMPYRAPLPPGAALAAPGDADPTPELRAADSETGRPNFRAVLVTVQRIDWLYLAARGHRRAAFVWHGDDFAGRWLAP